MRVALLAALSLLVTACGAAAPTPSVVSLAPTTPVAAEVESATPSASQPSAAPPSPTPTENLGVPARASALEWPPAGATSTKGGCDRPRWPAAEAVTLKPGQARRVVVIGDSLTREVSLQSESGTPTSPRMRAALAEAGWTPTVVCWKGRTTEWAAEEIGELDRLGLLPPRVVVAMGTNDMWVDDASTDEFESRVRRVLGTLASSSSTDGGPPRVWWVNLWVDKQMAAWNHEREPRDPDMAEYETYNEVLARACTSATNCRVIDWHRAVESDPSLPGRIVEPDLDGVHMTIEGASERAGLIVRALG